MLLPQPMIVSGTPELQARYRLGYRPLYTLLIFDTNANALYSCHQLNGRVTRGQDKTHYNCHLNQANSNLGRSNRSAVVEAIIHGTAVLYACRIVLYAQPRYSLACWASRRLREYSKLHYLLKVV
jgi:hypothetical protein